MHGLLLVTAKGVAEGRDREQVGDEAIRGKRVTGTPNKNMMERWQCFKKRATCVNLEPHVQ